MKSMFIAALVALLIVPLTMAQQEEPPPTGQVHGYVFDARTGLLLEDAHLVLRAGGPQTEIQSDAEGYFLFDEVAPGGYQLLVDRPGYVPDAYGIRRADGPPGTLRVSAGQQFETTFRLRPASSVDGRIYDEERRSLEAVRVELVTADYDGFGERQFRPVRNVGRQSPSSARTDENGEYRITGIQEGTYYVRAVPAAPRQAGTSVSAGTPVYYPGFLNPDQAAPVRIPEGLEVRAIDFTLPSTSLKRILGRVVNGIEPLPDGNRAYQFFLVPRNVSTRETVLTMPDYDPDPETFELRNIPFGSYDLHVGWGYQRIPDNPFLYVGRSPVDVGDEDATGVTVAIDPGVEVIGRIVLTGTATQRALGRDISLLLMSADGMPGLLGPTALLGRARRGSGFVETDGTFRIPYVFPGRYRLVPSIPPNLYASAARLGTENILGRVFEIGPGSGPLIIDVNGPGGQLEGVVLDRDDAPVVSASVVLVPGVDLREDFTAYKNVMTDAAGRFRISGIRPGRYTAFAFSEIKRNAWMNSTFMAPHLGRGVSIDVEQDERIQRDLEVIQAP